MAGATWVPMRAGVAMDNPPRQPAAAHIHSAASSGALAVQDNVFFLISLSGRKSRVGNYSNLE